MEYEYGAFLYEVENDHCVVKKLLHPDLILEIPPIVKGKNVTTIGERAFEGCKGVCSLTLPSTLGKIMPFAFAESEFQEISRSINYKSPILYIDRFAFADCYLLERVELGGATFLESSGYQFKECIKLVTIDSMVIRGGIPMGAFASCGLNMFVFSDGAKIGFDAFKDTKLNMVLVTGSLGNTSNFFKTHKDAKIICEDGNPISDLAYEGYDVAIKERSVSGK